MSHHSTPQRRSAISTVIQAFVIVLLFLSARVQAADAPTAVVIDVSGPVQLIGPDDQARDLVKGDLIPSGYTVDCGPGGHAVLEIDQGDRAEIAEDSQVQVGELFAAEESRFSLGLLLGRVTMALKKLRGDDVVVTPTFVCGIRGTRFSVGVADDGASVVTVFKGSVEVSLDDPGGDFQGADTPSRRLDAGQEILTESSEDALTPRPAAIRSLEDWRSFRQKRLEKMIPRLPQIVAKLDRRIDAEINILEKIAGLIISRADQVKGKIENARARQRPQRGRLRAQAQDLMKDLRMLRRQIKGFRRHVMRLRTIFARAAALQKKLPTLKDQIGPEYPDIEQALIRIQERKAPTRIKVKGLTSDIKDGLKPLAPIWNKFKKARQTLKQAP